MFPDGSRDMLVLLPLAPLDEAVVADRLPDGLVEAPSSVGDHQKALIKRESAVDQISEEPFDRLVMLGGGLREAKRNLFPLYGYP